MITAALEERVGQTTGQLWEVALRETVWSSGFRFAPDIKFACRKLGISPPKARRPFTVEGERFVAFGFAWPEEAIAFLAHFIGSGFSAHVSMPAEEIFWHLGNASALSQYEARS